MRLSEFPVFFRKGVHFFSFIHLTMANMPDYEVLHFKKISGREKAIATRIGAGWKSLSGDCV
jgi:hypothetical protein